jgi:1,4-alpha-glucan branching enzyme
MPRRRWLVPLALATVAALSLATGCSSLNFIKRRLPPPTQTKDGVRFVFYAPSAQRVQLIGQAQIGSFLVGEMKDLSGTGVWERTEKLPPGRYEYKFLIDRVNWKEDPNNPNRTDDHYGGFNSIVDVRD